MSKEAKVTCYKGKKSLVIKCGEILISTVKFIKNIILKQSISNIIVKAIEKIVSIKNSKLKLTSSIKKQTCTYRKFPKLFGFNNSNNTKNKLKEAEMLLPKIDWEMLESVGSLRILKRKGRKYF